MKRTLILVLGAIFLVGVVLLGKYVLWPERLEKLAIERLDVDLNLKNVNLSQGRDGRKLWNLQAAAATYDEGSDELTLSDPFITYWEDDQPEPLRVKAPKGQVWQKEDRARMWDGVRGTRGQYTMHSTTLDYTGTKREVLLTGSVRLVGDTMLASADSLVYFLESGDFFARDNVFVLLH